MRGLFFDFVNKQGLAERVGEAFSNEMTDREVEEQMKSLSFAELFDKSELQGLASEYKAFESQVVKSQEKPSRYLLKQKLVNPKGEAFYFTLAFSKTMKRFDVSSANILALDTGVMNQLSQKQMVAWEKTAIKDEEQLKEWAAAEYFNHHIYTEDPLKGHEYSRILNEFGGDTEYRKQLHAKNPLFFPINRMMHAEHLSFELITLEMIYARLRDRKNQFVDHPLPSLVDEMMWFVKWKNSLIHDRVMATPLLHDEYLRRIDYLKMHGNDKKFTNDALSSYGLLLSERLGESYFSLLNIAQGVYQSAVQSSEEDELLDEHSDRSNDLYTISFQGFINHLYHLGKHISDEQMKSAYHLYDDIINAKFEIFLDQLTNDMHSESDNPFDVARFLLVNEELCKKVREARPVWYYQFMMRFKQDELKELFVKECGHNKEARAISTLLNRQVTGDLSNDCRAALALFSYDANEGRCDGALLKRMVEKYGDALETNKQFYKLILSYPHDLINYIFSGASDTSMGDKVMASKQGHVTLDFEYDLMAAHALLKTKQSAVAERILNDMYSEKYYYALSFDQKNKLNGLCETETSSSLSFKIPQQKASQYKMASMGYWDRVTFLREDGRSWWRSLWDACVNKNNIVITDWSKLAFKLNNGMTTLKQLQKQYASKTDHVTLAPNTQSSDSRAILSQLSIEPGISMSASPIVTPASSPSSSPSPSPTYSPRDVIQSEVEPYASLRM